ncbi:CpsD/CapB family tyrosine-protein kinase [Bacillaceae bacterium]
MKKRKTAENRYISLITYLDPKSPVSEAYRTLRTNIQFAGVDREVKSILVTSSAPSEGKSTTIANLAVVLAQAEKRVVLIDADLRKPMIHHFFHCPSMPGLSHLLTGQRKLDEVKIPSFVKGLELIPSGPIPPNPAELLGSQRMRQLLQELSAEYDHVLVDAPPVLAVTDAQLLASQVDGVLLVVHAGKTDKEAAVKAKELLVNVQAKILGVVLNGRKIKGEGYYYYYYSEEKTGAS